MRPTETRISLLARLRDVGDAGAWWDFDQAYRDLILRYCTGLGLQAADAEDVRQQIMMQLARVLPEFDYDPSRGRFRSYLRTTVRNAVTNQLRRPKLAARAVDTHVEDSLADDGGDDPLWEREWMLHHYRLAMRSVRKSFDARSVAVFDALLQGRDVAGVAAEFEISTQAVHKVKQRIRNRLSELIQIQVHEEDRVDDDA